MDGWMDGRRARGREGEHVRGRIVGVSSSLFLILFASHSTVCITIQGDSALGKSPTDDGLEILPVMKHKLLVGLREDLTINLGQVEGRRFLGSHGYLSAGLDVSMRPCEKKE